jgi:hypothetical protein
MGTENKPGFPPAREGRAQETGQENSAFSFSAGERTIMNHFAVTTAIQRHAEHAADNLFLP